MHCSHNVWNIIMLKLCLYVWPKKWWTNIVQFNTVWYLHSYWQYVVVTVCFLVLNDTVKNLWDFGLPRWNVNNNVYQKHLSIQTKYVEGLCVCSRFLMHIFISLFFSFSQDGKTAEDLAHTDQHELIVSLLGKLKKVKKWHTSLKPVDKWFII